ncbi:transposase [Taibaiella lutea]|uniref:Transposase n=1 Tax=Taibaiella lutea TaxID=2608001 RepID=A0A5M6CQI8_9BACT|nr:transposase [Taibaiella lutea]KAA5536650.1 transposase [Taibaiella lutea]
MDDSLKMEIISSLQYLKSKNLIEVYGFVIMPNHIHLIWEMFGSNGKESPMGSLLKFTAHQFKKHLQNTNPQKLSQYFVGTKEKVYQFWQRDSLGIPMFSRAVIIQKMDYIHKNPISKRWNLVEYYDEYLFSSAKYYTTGVDEFNLLTNIQTIL